MDTECPIPRDIHLQNFADRNVYFQQPTASPNVLRHQNEITNSLPNQMNSKINVFPQNMNHPSGFVRNLPDNSAINVQRGQSLTSSNNPDSVRNEFNCRNDTLLPNDFCNQDNMNIHKQTSIQMKIEAMVKENMLQGDQQRIMGQNLQSANQWNPTGVSVPMTPPLTPVLTLPVVLTNPLMGNLDENHSGKETGTKRVCRAVKRNSSDRMRASSVALSLNQNPVR